MTTPDRAVWSSLPAETSRFVGRHQQLKQLVKLAAAHRLLTLVGPGGCGKTRLALRLARRRQKAFPGGVRYIDLALSSAISQPSDAREVPRSAQTDEPLLLVLDGCDVDIETSARMVASMLRHYPGLRIVATSREPLRLPEEVIWRVPLLSIPDEETTQLHRLQASEAGQLFVDRANGTADHATLPEERAQTIARVCRAVNGLPLAVEMVAVRSGELGVAVLAARATTPLLLGLPGRRDAPERQHSIRATLDWSYRRLTAAEQKVLCRLAVIAGDWSMDVARAICCNEGDLSHDVADVVLSLVDKSLVHFSGDGKKTRYRLLEVTRQYGREVLERTGAARSVYLRHLEWCVAMADAVAPEAMDLEHALRLERYVSEVHAALDWAVRSGETALGLRLATGAFPLWYLRSRITEGRTWFDRLLAQPLAAIAPEIVASARGWRTQLLIQEGDFAGAELELNEVIAGQRARSDKQGTAVSLMLLGNAMLGSGQLAQARELFDDAYVALSRVNSPGLSMAAYQAARVAWEQGELQRARVLLRRLLEFSLSNHPVMRARAHQLQGLLASAAGNWSAATRSFGEAERHLRRIDDTPGFVDFLLDRGHVLLTGNQIAAAHQTYVNAAALACTIGARVRLIRALEGVASVLATTQPALCVQLAAAATASRTAFRAIAGPHDAARLSAALSTARSRLRRWRDPVTAHFVSAAYTQAWQIGTVLPDSEAAAMAIATLSATPPKAIGEVPSSVTRREWEVAQLFASGSTARQIAEKLTLSPDTVRTHLDRATAKLGLHSRVQLAMWVARSQASA